MVLIRWNRFPTLFHPLPPLCDNGTVWRNTRRKFWPGETLKLQDHSKEVDLAFRECRTIFFRVSCSSLTQNAVKENSRQKKVKYIFITNWTILLSFLFIYLFIVSSACEDLRLEIQAYLPSVLIWTGWFRSNTIEKAWKNVPHIYKRNTKLTDLLVVNWISR